MSLPKFFFASMINKNNSLWLPASSKRQRARAIADWRDRFRLKIHQNLICNTNFVGLLQECAKLCDVLVSKITFLHSSNIYILKMIIVGWCRNIYWRNSFKTHQKNVKKMHLAMIFDGLIESSHRRTRVICTSNCGKFYKLAICTWTYG